MATALVTLMLAAAALADPAGDEPPQLRITPGAGAPGAVVSQTIYLFGDVSLRGISLRIRVPADALSLERVALSYPLGTLGAEVTIDVQDPFDGEQESGIAIEIALPAGRAASLPQGPLADLQFRVGHDAAVGSQLTVEAEARGLPQDDPPGTEEPLRAQTGLITIVPAEPAIACFFYMH